MFLAVRPLFSVALRRRSQKIPPQIPKKAPIPKPTPTPIPAAPPDDSLLCELGLEDGPEEVLELEDWSENVEEVDETEERNDGVVGLADEAGTSDLC